MHVLSQEERLISLFDHRPEVDVGQPVCQSAGIFEAGAYCLYCSGPPGGATCDLSPFTAVFVERSLPLGTLNGSTR